MAFNKHFPGEAIAAHRKMWDYLYNYFKDTRDIPDPDYLVYEYRNFDPNIPANPVCDWAKKVNREVNKGEAYRVDSCKYCPASVPDTIFQDRVLSFKCFGGLIREFDLAVDHDDIDRVISLCKEIRDYQFKP